MVVWKNSKHPEICKAFIESFYEPETYVPFLHSVPVGMLPALKEITNDPTFLSDPTIQKYEAEMRVISDALSHGTYMAPASRLASLQTSVSSRICSRTSS